MAVQLVTNILRYIGLSTDTKPTSVPVGSMFLATDIGCNYLYDGSSWVSQCKGGILWRSN